MMRIQRDIVVIDDDAYILRLVKTVLGADGHHVRTAATATDGIGLALDPRTDLVVLDLNLPDTNGLDVARLVRASSDVPILMLTGRADVASRVSGLDAGADDYVPKPFNLDELKARVRSILRRCDLTPDKESAETDKLVRSGWRLDTRGNAIVIDGGQPVALTERESMILAVLVRRADTVVSRNELQRHVAGREWQTEDRSLDVHMSHLRKKLRAAIGDRETIRTVRGRGYCFQGAV